MTDSEHSDNVATSALPGSFRVQLDAGIERHLGTNGELVLLGGDPLRLLRLSDRSAAIVASLESGDSLVEVAATHRATLRTVSNLARRLLDAGIAHPMIPARSGAKKSTLTPQNPENEGSFPASLSIDQPHFGTNATNATKVTKVTNVTMVVPVKDRAAELDRLLRSVRANPDTAQIPIIVVDDGSSTPTRATHGASVVRHATSRGPAAARNAGVQVANSEFVAFVDSDCEIVDPHWLATCVAHFDDPQVAVVAPRIVAKQSANPSALHAYESARSSLDLGPAPAKVAPMHRVAYVPAAALVIRKEVFEALGGFDEALYVGEDVDFVWRANEANHTVRYEPAATVAHDHRTTYQQFVKRRFQYATSTAPLDQRHPGQVPPVVLSPWSAGVWAAVATQTPMGLLSALGIAAYSGAKFPKKLSMLREPGPTAARLVARGHWGAGRQLASATWRTYIPIALLLSARSKRAKRWTIAAALIHNALDYRQRKPKMNPLTYIGIRLLDDTSYCAGLWWGCITNRNLKPLLPKMNNWPGRRNVNEDS
jgi:mycofactocin glycosyltransferase